MPDGQSRHTPLRSFLALAATHALTRVQHVPNHDVPTQGVYGHGSQHFNEDSFAGIIPLMRRAMVIAGCASSLIFASALLYGVFYIAAMPSHCIAENLFFDYSGESPF